MLPIERLKKIEEMLSDNGSVMVNSLSELFNVSEETIRRDFEKLEKQNKLKRVRGGAYLPENFDNGAPIHLREKILLREKELIAEKCMEFINDGDSIMLDSSTTALYVAKSIKNHKRNVTIVTNSLKVMQEFEDTKNSKLICVGGTLRTSSNSLVGYTSTDNLKRYYTDKAFVSCSSLNAKFGVSDNNELEAMVRKAMLDNSARKFLIVDNTKFDLHSPYNICSLKEIDAIITDRNVSSAWEKISNTNDIQLLSCEV